MDLHSQENIKRNLLRQEMLARRDKLTTPDHQEKSRLLAQHLQGLDCYQQARSILFFASFRSEVDTFSLMRQAMKNGVQVSVPLTLTKGRDLKVFVINDLEADLVSGYQGILEPNSKRCSLVDPATLDLVIVPGSVFDLQGGRMGYGGGYYDRFLAEKAPQATRVGICFDVQLVDQVPMAAHDQYLDYVITESQIARSGRLR